jgi:hypothetical protein
VATDGSISSSPNRCRHNAGRNGMMAAVSITPEPSAFAIATLPARVRLEQARHAERRVAAQLERIAKAVVEPPEDDVDRLESSSVLMKTRRIT